MYNLSKNRIVLRSLNQLTNALLILMKNHSIHEITITQICQEAKVARKTFYRNCTCKDDLVYFMMLRAITPLIKVFLGDRLDNHASIVRCFEYWYDKRAFLTLIAQQGLFPLFLKIFIESCRKDIGHEELADLINENDNIEKTAIYRYAFIIGGLGNMLEVWTWDQFQMPISELVEIFEYQAT